MALSSKQHRYVETVLAGLLFRLRYSVHFDDVTFVREVSGEVVPHENLPWVAHQPDDSNSKLGERLPHLEF
jgi:hypothetical protein